MNNAYESYIEKMHNPQRSAPVQQNISIASPADELLKYAELYEKGLLTKEEFDLKKKHLLYDSEDEVKETENTSQTLYCGNCGSPLDGDSNFCTNCGNKIK